MNNYTDISKFSKKEETANALSHFAGAILSVFALVLMISKASDNGDLRHVFSVIVYGTSLIILYFSSTMTHYLQQGKLKNKFFSLDKIAIYLLIAGTFTPLTIIALSGTLGWIIFGIEWGIALIGSYFILIKPVEYDKGVNTITVTSYAVMGWLILIVIIPLIKQLPVMGWLLVLIGGVLYTIGIYFYKKCNFKYHHLVWHLFVIAGSISHFFSIYFYVIPE